MPISLQVKLAPKKSSSDSAKEVCTNTGVFHFATNLVLECQTCQTRRPRQEGMRLRLGPLYGIVKGLISILSVCCV